MKKITKSLFALALLNSTYSFAEVSATVTLASDYMFRGISQTDNGAAAQASLDYSHETGAFAGIFVSNIDFGDDGDVEIDYYAGYAGGNDTMDWDISYTYYTYTGYSGDEDYNYGELIANAYIDNLTLSLGYSNDYFQTGESASYIGASYDFTLTNDYTLTTQAGYSIGEDALGENIVDYSLTVSKSFNQFDVAVALTDTNLDDVDTADTRLVLSVSRTF